MKKPAKPAKSAKPKATVPKAKAAPKPIKKVVKKPAPEAAKPAPPKIEPKLSAPVGISEKEQTQLFERAMQLFHKADYAKAAPVFKTSTDGPSLEKRHAAQMHIKMCERRIHAQSGPQTAEDYFTLGVSLMNRGEHADAEENLRKALAKNAKADHYLYALALCLGQRGKGIEAAEALAKAIELAPQNRIAARNDAEFQALMSQPAIRDVLYPERSNPGQS